MQDSEVHAWSRHYDSLLWQVTAVFTAGIGGLLAYSVSSFYVEIALAGLALTCLPVYFAASFRESRDKINKHLGEKDRGVLFADRKLKQWKPYVSVFLILQVFWAWLLLKNRLELWWIWLALLLLALGFTVYWSHLGRAQIPVPDANVEVQKNHLPNA